MPNEIDELMDRDPLSLTKADLDAIIAYHRNARAREGTTGRGKAAPKSKVDLTSLVQGMVKPKAEPLAPTMGGLRRV